MAAMKVLLLHQIQVQPHKVSTNKEPNGALCGSTGSVPTECGAPTHADWVYVREFKQFLQHFYDLTNKVSGSKYVTSNTFFEEIAAVSYLLGEWSEHVICGDDEIFKSMAIKMKDKYDKYWGDPEKMNKYIFIAAILDPRY